MIATAVDSASMSANAECQLRALLDAIYRRYDHDFREYAPASLRRRMHWAMRKLQLKSFEQLHAYVLQAPAHFSDLLQYLTVPVSTMFRDPDYFLTLRRQVLPILKTYPSPRIWIAGCSTGEEAYSLAILLREENLLERSIIYATDINPRVLAKAERGIFSIDRIAEYTENYHRAGGSGDFSAYYHAAYGHAIFDKHLRKNMVFVEHSLATDHVFAEVQLISCRNVLIYFTRELQDRALVLFHEALCRKGYLGIGARESLDFSVLARNFDVSDKQLRIFRKNDVPPAR